jgi:hypothetical protein
VIRGALGLTRLICCGLVIVSFALFAVDQAGGASRHQVAELNGNVPTQTAAATAGDANTPPLQRYVDDATNVLEAPFRSVVSSDNQWAQRGFATACALLLYGLGLGYVARYSQGRA